MTQRVRVVTVTAFAAARCGRGGRCRPPLPAWGSGPRGGLAQGAVDRGAADGTLALGHVHARLRPLAVPLEVPLLLALDAVAVVRGGHGSSSSIVGRSACRPRRVRFRS